MYSVDPFFVLLQKTVILISDGAVRHNVAGDIDVLTQLPTTPDEVPNTEKPCLIAS
jgi:hypothetical protein